MKCSSFNSNTIQIHQSRGSYDDLRYISKCNDPSLVPDRSLPYCSLWEGICLLTPHGFRRVPQNSNTWPPLKTDLSWILISIFRNDSISMLEPLYHTYCSFWVDICPFNPLMAFFAFSKIRTHDFYLMRDLSWIMWLLNGLASMPEQLYRTYCLFLVCICPFILSLFFIASIGIQTQYLCLMRNLNWILVPIEQLL